MAKGAKTGGRRPGSLNRVTALIRERIEQEADPIGFLARVARGETIEGPAQPGAPASVVIPTLDQRMTAAMKLADKVVPPAKSLPISLDLPPIHTAADVLSALSAVVRAAGAGQITPDDAATIAGVLDIKRRAIEMVEIEARLAKLEQRFEKKGPQP